MDVEDVFNDPKIWADFDKAWSEAKVEIFRLQLLNTYKVPDEEKDFNSYLKGEVIPLSEGFSNWMKQISDMKSKGIRLINLLVVDVPLSDYIKFSVDTYLSKTSAVGQDTLMVERGEVLKVIDKIQDFWMFDKKTIIPMNYDAEGHLLGVGKAITNGKEVDKYVQVRNNLMAVAQPMNIFMELEAHKNKHINNKSLSY